MKGVVKGAAVGFAWFLAYVAVHQLVVRPAAQKFGVPVLKDL
jgi:hypothetical protein